MIEKNFPLPSNLNVFQKIQGKNFSKLLTKPNIKAGFDDVIKSIPSCYDPKLIYDVFKITTIQSGKIVFAEDKRIGNPHLLAFLEESTSILLGICTIGNKFDKQKENYHSQQDQIKQVYLHNIGSYLVTYIQESFYIQKKNEFRNKNLYISPPFSPGGKYWNLEDQKVIFSVLHPEHIGMELKESLLMVPLKSLSFLFGISSKPFSQHSNDQCERCTLNSRCRFRINKKNEIQIAKLCQ